MSLVIVNLQYCAHARVCVCYCCCIVMCNGVDMGINYNVIVFTTTNEPRWVWDIQFGTVRSKSRIFKTASASSPIDPKINNQTQFSGADVRHCFNPERITKLLSSFDFRFSWCEAICQIMTCPKQWSFWHDMQKDIQSKTEYSSLKKNCTPRTLFYN